MSFSNRTLVLPSSKSLLTESKMGGPPCLHWVFSVSLFKIDRYLSAPTLTSFTCLAKLSTSSLAIALEINVVIQASLWVEDRAWAMHGWLILLSLNLCNLRNFFSSSFIHTLAHKDLERSSKERSITCDTNDGDEVPIYTNTTWILDINYSYNLTVVILSLYLLHMHIYQIAH